MIENIIIKTVMGHVEIYDLQNRFLCSGDDECDALEGYMELMKKVG